MGAEPAKQRRSNTMQLILKDFDIFTFYTSEDGSNATYRAQTKMCEYLTKLMEINPRLRLELSRSTNSGLTIATIFEQLGKQCDIAIYADRKEDFAVINISKKEEVK